MSSRNPKPPEDYYPLLSRLCPHCRTATMHKRYRYCGKPACREKHLDERRAKPAVVA